MIRLAVRVQRQQAELVLAELLELAPSGVEEVELAEDLIEFAVYGAAGELPQLPELRAAAGSALVEVRTSEVADDWESRWRDFHRPLVLEGQLTVRPPWEPRGETPLDVVIDPAQAFGTGTHATTRLCLELMLELEPEGSFLDLGCGSGVLGIVAAQLGWEPVLAVDNDPVSVATTASNSALNDVELRSWRLDLRDEDPPAAETVAANLLGPLLHRLARRIGAAAWRPRRMVASGLLVEEADGVATAFAGAGLIEVTRRERSGWGALLLGAAA